MLKEMIHGHIQIVTDVEDWKQGIRLAAEPLRREAYITDNYMEAMKNSVIENGPYMVVMPGVAIPHARPEQGVQRTGMSLLLIKEGVEFPGENHIHLMIVLAAEDAEVHLDVISELTDVFMDDEIMEQLFAAATEEVMACF